MQTFIKCLLCSFLINNTNNNSICNSNWKQGNICCKLKVHLKAKRERERERDEDEVDAIFGTQAEAEAETGSSS